MKKPKKIDFKQSLLNVAKLVEKEPSDVTVAEYLNSGLEVYNEWMLRKNGGFNNLKNLFFPKEKDIVIDTISKTVRKHRNKIEAEYGKQIMFKEEFLKLLDEKLSETKFYLHKPVKPLKQKLSANRTIVAHLSDCHYGVNISKTEMNGTNEFNWTIAARRTAFFINQAVSYKPQHRDNTELVLPLNGDNLAGVIHDQEYGVDLMATQFSGALSILTQAISYAAQHFSKVRVVCTTGNHSRFMHKSSKDRATSMKWDSFETMLYTALKEVFKTNYKNIEVIVPEAPFAVLDIQGHKFLQTHGDTVINVGNPGRNINMSSINNQINNANSNLLKGEEKFSGIIVGHVHVPTVQITDSGTVLLINGSLSGTDAYAQSLGIFDSHPSQTIFEVTKEYAVGDIRFVRLKDADQNSSLDAVIRPFEGKF